MSLASVTLRLPPLLSNWLTPTWLLTVPTALTCVSLENVTFVTGDAGVDEKFVATAKTAGLDGLKGHRSVGGMRASLYNAFPPAGVDALIEVMRDFEAQHG